MTETRHEFSAVEDRLRVIEECDSIDSLKRALLKIIEPLGFHGFNHIDTGRPDQIVPLFFGSFLPEWGDCYIEQNFGAVDPTLLIARRSTLPFRWTDIPLPKKTQGPTPGAHATFNAASDFGYEQGVVYPWHSRDRLGRPCSALTVLLWRDSRRRFDPLWEEQRHALQITMLYWQDKAAQFLWPTGQSGVPMLDEDGELLNAPRLTDRERDVLAWAARGKTVGVTAEILGIATDTAENHIRAAMRKLGATNKTHGVARAIHLGFIDP